MSKEAAKTGSGPAVVVAIEQNFPQGERIIDDDLAYRILPAGMRFWGKITGFRSVRDWMVRVSEKDIPGVWFAMLGRKLYMDEKLTEMASGVDAVVNLGAGFDTRAYRMPALSDMPVWEVDQPVIIRTKKARLLKIFGSVPENVRLVPVDLETEDLTTVLASHGYSPDKKIFFIFEAVTQYLTEKGNRATFDFMAKAAPGSRLAFTYVRRDFIEGRNMCNSGNAYKRFLKKDPPLWLFGLDPEEWPGFLEEYGWKVDEDLGYGDLHERYVRKTGRELGVMELERILYAEKS
jgi:methyltransferase (TIGR00027 family)